VAAVWPVSTVSAMHVSTAYASAPDEPPTAARVQRAPRARCADGHGTLMELFFSHDDFDVARAKAICSRCPLAATCLEGALQRKETCGVWGGILLVDGVPAALPPRRGRPAAVARIEAVVDEVRRPDHLVA
jgi:WhiB family transcriptional regulator, redox-sensing transcriptional regulator